ncbi:hypothetical protein LTR64_000735 [Lithohypha guttulata]|uniref:uncharacterized protein n=1 Tax=Lithohypha guttulata TaxID=1690604 RepID=UPI002DDF1668|nr:hypothetical protein LTR51_005496 [Lithohypha guttulata]
MASASILPRLVLLHEPERDLFADLIFIHTVVPPNQKLSQQDEDYEFSPSLAWLHQEEALSGTRIWAYSYSFHDSPSRRSEALDMSHLAEDFLSSLHRESSQNDTSPNIGAVPIIFVSHGLGGLLAKQAYLLCRNGSKPDFDLITQSIVAFVFFSTPHRGVDRFEVLRAVLDKCVPAWWSKLDMLSLQIYAQALSEINDRFSHLVPHVDIVSFYEDNSAGTNSALLPVLQQETATLGSATEKCIELAAGSAPISSFTSISFPDYEKVRDVLRYLVEKFRRYPPSTSRSSAEQDLPRIAEFLGVEGPPEDDHNWYAEKRVSGTCDFALRHEAFTSWSKDISNTLSVLYCYGRPGSGKSVTTSHIVDHLVERDLPCAYYYFRAGDHVKNNLILFVLSLAFQIATFDINYRNRLCRLADDGFNISKFGYKMLWKKLVITNLIKVRLPNPIYVVVDGVDELDAAVSKELISKLFLELSNVYQPLRLLIVSRPMDTIETAVDRLARHLQPAIQLQKMAFDGHEDDVQIYVEEEMQAMPGDDSFKQQTYHRIIQKADGNFLWAHLVVREILECSREDDVEDALNTVPEELDPLYSRMDQRQADALQHRRNDKRLGQSILTWACCSRYPLALKELSEALSPEFERIIDIPQTIQKLCGGFVVVDKKLHLSMMHASARDFLLSQPKLNYYIQPDKAHQKLFHKCVQRLITCHADVRQVLKRSEGFVKYAAESWPFHLASSCGWLDQDSLSMLCPSTQSLGGCLEGFNDISPDRGDHRQEQDPLQHQIADREYLSLWAQDLLRIVGKFGSQILLYTTSIYDLIPAFCAKNSAIYRKFVADTPASSLTIRGSTSQDWDDCLAKFVVPGQSLPQSITGLDRHFAILTGDGIVRLFYSSTYEEARSFLHGEPVLAMCFTTLGDRLATCGLRKTKIWDTTTARPLCTIDNPPYTKALSICFKVGDENVEAIQMFSDDALIRSCSMAAAHLTWKIVGPCKSGLDPHERTNSPRNAQFSPDGSQIAVNYRGVHPTVWSLDSERPQMVSQCQGRSAAYLAFSRKDANFVDAQAFYWHPISGHLLGIYNDGCVFKWHPTSGEHHQSDIGCNGIKCNTDGKLFVTSSGDGTLRIWDFEHFAPIYELTYTQGIRDICIDWNEARIYDIRDMYCHAWQPSALLRLLESDDRISDAISSQDSTYQLSLAEAQQQNGEQITALLVLGSQDRFVVGDEAGQAYLCNFEGKKVAKLAEGYIGIEHIACCQGYDVVAVADLGRDVTIRSILEIDKYDSDSVAGNLSWSVSEPSSITQLLFHAEGKMLLVSTKAGLRIYDISQQLLLSESKDMQQYYWLNHAEDSSLLLGIGTGGMQITSWHDLSDASIYRYDRSYVPQLIPPIIPENSPPSSQRAERESAKDSIFVERVLVSPDSKYYYVQTRSRDPRVTRRHGSFFMKLQHKSRPEKRWRIPTTPLTSNLIENLNFGLGFVAIDHRSTSSSRRSSAPAMLNTRRVVPRPHPHERIFAFIDHNYWVCTVNLGSDDNTLCCIRKHFFLPRDWQNAEWLASAAITKTGVFLCPRNGEVVVVSDGLTYEWIDN